MTIWVYIASLKLLTSFPIVSTVMSIQISRSQNQATARCGTTWCLSNSCRSQGWLPGNDHFFEWYTPENAQFVLKNDDWQRTLLWGLSLFWRANCWISGLSECMSSPCLNDWQMQKKSDDDTWWVEKTFQHHINISYVSMYTVLLYHWYVHAFCTSTWHHHHPTQLKCTRARVKEKMIRRNGNKKTSNMQLWFISFLQGWREFMQTMLPFLR